MSESFHLNKSLSGLMAMMPMVGYTIGLYFIVPLADLLPSRLLVLRILTCAAVSAAAVSLAPNIYVLFIALLLLGASCSVIQVLMPTAAAMTSPENRGRVIGDIMSGLMTGILFARPLASALAGLWSWRIFFASSSFTMACLIIFLSFKLQIIASVEWGIDTN